MEERKEGDLGYLVKKMREKQRISQSSLCRGLCSNATLCRIENGERDIEIPLAIRFFQRLGYSSDKFELYGTPEELEQYEEQQKIVQCRNRKDFSRMKTLMEEYQQKYLKDSSGIGLQFLYTNRGVIESLDGNDSAGISLMRKAIDCTVPGWQRGDWSHYLLGEEELELFAILGNMFELSGDMEKAFSIREDILKYLDNRSIQREQVVKLYTRLVCGMAPYLLEKGYGKKSLHLCEHGLSVLTDTGKLSRWPELLYWKGKSLEVLQKKGEKKVTERQIVDSFQRAYYIFRLFGNEEMAAEAKLCLEVYGWESIKSEK